MLIAVGLCHFIHKVAHGHSNSKHIAIAFINFTCCPYHKRFLKRRIRIECSAQVHCIKLYMQLPPLEATASYRVPRNMP